MSPTDGFSGQLCSAGCSAPTWPYSPWLEPCQPEPLVRHALGRTGFATRIGLLARGVGKEPDGCDYSACVAVIEPAQPRGQDDKRFLPQRAGRRYRDSTHVESKFARGGCSPRATRSHKVVARSS